MKNCGPQQWLIGDAVDGSGIVGPLRRRRTYRQQLMQTSQADVGALASRLRASGARDAHASGPIRSDPVRFGPGDGPRRGAQN